MRSALDTNILIALWSATPEFTKSRDLLIQARSAGGLVICCLVYGELLAQPGIKAGFVDEFLTNTGIEVDFHLSREIMTLASGAHAAYTLRRRQAAGSEPRRILTDFVIGAHAIKRADRLISFNSKDFRLNFPKLAMLP